MFEGFLEHTSGLHPHAGYRDLVFGLFGLLGPSIQSALGRLGEARFWRITTDADYGVLNDLARARIRSGLIQRHWEDMCCGVTGSLKGGHR